MKLCKDCQYGQGARCGKIPDRVNGGDNYEDFQANKSVSRSFGFIGSLLMGTCGKRARWFVPLKANSSPKDFNSP